MPVIVVGADAPPGLDITAALAGRGGELRVFVTDAAAADHCRDLGAKVAQGDVSDASHVAGAIHDAFTAVFIAAAADDERERAFAADAEAVYAAWGEAVQTAPPQRIIWVGDAGEAPTAIRGDGSAFCAVDPAAPDVAQAVATIDSAAELTPGTA